MRTRNFLFATIVMAAGLIACDKQSDAEYPEPTGAYGTTTTGAGYGQGGAGATANPTGGAGATAPTDTSHATPIAIGLLSPLAVPALRGLADKDVNGMTEDGAMLAGTFQQGQILEQEITLQPGRCYSVVALGLGITELDVELVVHQPPAPEWIAATGNMQGPQDVLGKAPNCFKNPLPIGGPAKIRIRATGGQGVAVAQLYSR
jgi:hypothetical protein